MIKTRQDAIETLCELQSHVSANVMGYDRPNNCFCGEHKGEFRSCGESIGFIVPLPNTLPGANSVGWIVAANSLNSG